MIGLAVLLQIICLWSVIDYFTSKAFKKTKFGKLIYRHSNNNNNNNLENNHTRLAMTDESAHGLTSPDDDEQETTTRSTAYTPFNSQRLMSAAAKSAIKSNYELVTRNETVDSKV